MDVHTLQTLTSTRDRWLAGSGKLRFSRLMIALVLALSTIVGFDVSVASADSTYYPPLGSWHGRKVYLSPALHYPENIGCDGYQESTGARRIALNVRDYLLARGYAIRVGSGTYTANVTSSNAWGSTVHIPIHSNATTLDCTAPYNFNLGGTWLMYRTGSATGSNLAQKIFDAMKAFSPGTLDLKGTDEALAGFQLHELRATVMPAAYVESAFHTLRPDVDWLRLSVTVASKIGAGIDNYFGNPRCPCPTFAPPDESSPMTASADDPNPMGARAAATEPSRSLEASFRTLLAEAEGTATAAGGAVEAVRVSADGVAIVNFSELPALAAGSTTNGARTQLAELNAVAFADSSVVAVEYRLNGSCSEFWISLQALCQRIER